MKRTTETRPSTNRTHVKIGDLVTVDVAEGSFKGMVVEDRGPIGAGGRRLYGIVEIDTEPTAIELPEEQFSEVATFGSSQFFDELYGAIVNAARRSNADIIVSDYGLGDVQVRGRSMLRNIPDRSAVVRKIDAMLDAEAKKSPPGRIVLRDRNSPAGQSRQHWYFVRPG